ncbi:grasp-with-spasm system SPASM domain peptide maturase [Geofilum rubicundum]|uniref:Grasp-with-spasm system SPASM domain peptide maturase n=1 Tax=Geofilum rubicundum JCM 15548 TaxID=1236989 RepID=A0A0E9LR23_9BACT|nr:grasp-with-spasm system SPASM domain peptide maturase [Geofilum rubicundum]GAO27586.1 hypothetical protein JCM15548_14422 [Geofilum rubicundum JCM 15548]
MGKSKVLKLFACCVPVKGSARSIIYDLQRRRYFIIPNALYDILQTEMGKTIDEIKGIYSADEHEIFDRYLRFLIDNEIVFECAEDYVHLFPSIDFSWESAFVLENFILDIDEFSNHDFAYIINELSDLNVRVLQLRLFSQIAKKQLDQILRQITGSNIRTVELVMPLSYLEFDSACFVEEFTKISNLIIYGAEEDVIHSHKQANIVYTKAIVRSEKDCGLVEQDLFSCNLKFFCEAQQFNTCLNRKLAIDKHGEIRNCPAMKDSYGNIKSHSLRAVLKKMAELKTNWSICKDKISVCKDCEYRYMCHDCRAFITNPSDKYSQPAKCDYNPYVAKWKGEKGFIPVEDMK